MNWSNTSCKKNVEVAHLNSDVKNTHLTSDIPNYVSQEDFPKFSSSIQKKQQNKNKIFSLSNLRSSIKLLEECVLYVQN